MPDEASAPTVLGTRDDDRRTAVERINGPRFVPQEDVPMTPDQFAELKGLLVDLLTPGFKLSSLMLAQYEADQARRAQYEAEKPAPDAEASQVDTKPPAPPQGAYATLESAINAAAVDGTGMIPVEHDDGSYSIAPPPAPGS